VSVSAAGTAGVATPPPSPVPTLSPLPAIRSRPLQAASAIKQASMADACRPAAITLEYAIVSMVCFLPLDSTTEDAQRLGKNGVTRLTRTRLSRKRPTRRPAERHRRDPGLPASRCGPWPTLAPAVRGTGTARGYPP